MLLGCLRHFVHEAITIFFQILTNVPPVAMTVILIQMKQHAQTHKDHLPARATQVTQETETHVQVGIIVSWNLRKS